MVKSVAEQIREMGNRLSAINSLPKRSLTEITGVDPNTPSLWAKSKKGSVQLDDVAEVQKFLNDQGFDAGKVDGWYGRGTARAIQAFQKKYGLKVDGDAGTNTLSKMHEIANPQDPEDQQDTDGLDAMSNAPTDGRGTVNQPREVSRLLVGNLNDYVFKYSPGKAEELKDTHDVVFISDFGNRDRDNLLLLPMPSAMANKSALPTNTDGPLFSNQGIPLDQPKAPRADPPVETDPVGDAKRRGNQSLVGDLRRFNELLDKLTKSPENAGTDFRHLISIVENILLKEELSMLEKQEIKVLYDKIKQYLGADPALDTQIQSALNRYEEAFPTQTVQPAVDGPEPAPASGPEPMQKPEQDAVLNQIKKLNKELNFVALLELLQDPRVVTMLKRVMPKNYENMVKDVEEKAAVQREREKQDGTGGPRADPPKVPATNGGDGSIAVPRAAAPVETDPVKLAAIVTQIQQLLNKKDYKKVLELLKNPNAVKAMKTKFRNPSRYDSWLKGVKSQAAGKAAGAGTDSAGAAGASSTGGAVANKTGVVKKSLPPRATPRDGGNPGGAGKAQQFIDKNTESLANDIINMMNEATFDTSTSLWRASGGGKRKLPAVKQMQQWLNNNGFDAGKADGWYGKGTARAVKAMQQAYGLSADGDAGPNTLSAMNKASPEPVDQDAEIAAMAAQTKGDLDQDDSVGAVGAAGAAAAGAAGAATGDPEPDQTVTTTAPVVSTDAGIDAATDNVNKSMAAGNVTGVQSDAEKAAADLKAKQDASSAAAQAQFQKTKGDVSDKLKNAPDQTVKTVAPVDSTDAGIGAASDVISTAQSRGNVVGQDSDAEKAAAATRAAQDADAAAAQAQFQKTKGDVSDKLSGAPDQTITTTGGAAANAGKAGNRGGVDTAIAAKTAELNKSAEQRKAEQLRRRQAKAALQRRSSASSSVQGRDDNVNTGAGVGTNSGNWKPKAGTVVRQSMYKESGIKFSGSIANAIAKLGKKR